MIVIRKPQNSIGNYSGPYIPTPETGGKASGLLKEPRRVSGL